MQAMARNDYTMARAALNRTRPMTLEYVLRYATVDLLVHGQAADALSRRAMRIIEAVWLAARRGDATALRRPDAWAGEYLEGQRDDERLSGIRLLDKAEVYSTLVSEAGRMRAEIEKYNTKAPVTAANAARFISTFMSAALTRVAPEITGMGMIDATRSAAAKATIAREYERAWERGKPLDDAKVARLTLRAFSNSDVAGSYGKARAMRRSRRRKQRDTSR
jgi:hypothetical protein